MIPPRCSVRSLEGFCIINKAVVFFRPTETRGEVSGEPARADRLRVPRAGGAGVQPSPAGARGHAALQTPPAELLAAAPRQERRSPFFSPSLLFSLS